MAYDALFHPTIHLLERSLDLRKENHLMLTSNIANAETPGYISHHLEFEKELQEVAEGRMTATHSGHMEAKDDFDQVSGTVVAGPKNGIGDGNGVYLPQEMVRMSENQIKYEGAVKMLSKKFAFLQYVIQQTS